MQECSRWFDRRSGNCRKNCGRLIPPVVKAMHGESAVSNTRVVNLNSRWSENLVPQAGRPVRKYGPPECPPNSSLRHENQDSNAEEQEHRQQDDQHSHE